MIIALIILTDCKDSSQNLPTQAADVSEHFKTTSSQNFTAEVQVEKETEGIAFRNQEQTKDATVPQYAEHSGTELEHEETAEGMANRSKDRYPSFSRLKVGDRQQAAGTRPTEPNITHSVKPRGAFELLMIDVIFGHFFIWEMKPCRNCAKQSSKTNFIKDYGELRTS